MKTLHYYILFAVIAIVPLNAQDSTQVDASSTEEHIALWTMTGIIIPLAIAGTVVSVLPPSIGIVANNGTNYGALNIESGIGFGEKRETGIFSEWRAGLSYTHVFSSSIRDVYRMEVKKEFNGDYIDRRKIFVSGFHISAGLLSDFPNHGYSLGAGAWIKSPWLSYFGYFPQHTYGITYRYNKYVNGSDFHEIMVGMTSAFTF